MSDDDMISDEKIQDYIDGRLSDRDLATVAAYLLANPKKAAEVQKLRDQNDALKAMGSEILSEPLPEQLRGIIDQARLQHPEYSQANIIKRKFADALVVVSAVFIGMVIGWISHSYLTSSQFSEKQMALLAGRDAYLFHSAERDYPVEFTTDREEELSKWLEKSFGRKISRPRFDDAGYQYLGGRIVPWAGGRMGLQLFESNNGNRAAFIFWPEEKSPKQNQLHRILKIDDVQMKSYWQDGLGYAMVTDKANNDFENLANIVVNFFSAPKKQ